MKSRLPCILSLALNLALAATLVVLGRNRPVADAGSPAPVAPPAAETAAKTATPAGDESAVTNFSFHWRQIESPDYRQYVANLRGIGCPEATLRDIIVSDLDQLYAAKSKFVPVDPPPWHNAVRRSAEERDRADKEAALKAEKRALVKELIGYEWDHDANEAWHQDSITALLLGFLPDSKPPRLLAIVGKYSDQGARIRDAANGILIEEDRVRLGKLCDAMWAEAAQLLGPAEREELELRTQAATFIPAHHIQWTGVAMAGSELREYTRLSKSFEDTLRNQILDVNHGPEEEQAPGKDAFEKQVEKLLGPARFADYRRAQDLRFQELFEFTRENNLPQTAAISVYNSRRSAEDQAARVKSDESLSPEQRAAALAILKATTVKTVSAGLGNSYRAYLDGPGQWLEGLAATPTEGPNAKP